MIKKILGILTVIFLLIMFWGPVKAQEESTPEPQNVSSYEMFWPIVAGKTKGDSLYSLKLLKEKIRGFFIFGSFKKAEYNITLSEKRTVEAEKLLNEGDFENAEETFDLLMKKREKALEYIEKATKSGIDTASLKNRMLSSLEKQTLLFTDILKDISESGKVLIEKDLGHIASVSEKLK